MKEAFQRRKQIIGFLAEAECGTAPSKRLCRRHGFSGKASYYLWRSKFGGMSVPDAKRLKELESRKWTLENSLLRRVATGNGGSHREALRKK